ncbi:MAG: hypothetical protein CVV24_02715 [Ignavibacteriae bacterium HGW-Ignavibacteriae-3]|nr:MAG: hypothetical protein CVV24_02715 [Ignavibacteriae bacterium HGW-Ignavibacteriae-3]
METEQPLLMIYGANGYSAKLIIEELISKGIRPILAGRSETDLKQLSQLYKCEYRSFDLNDESTVVASIEDVHTVLNCAGPFLHTAKDLMEACLISKTNYIDITGEMPVMHLAFSLERKAREKGIVFLPSAGFDIILTDCLAKRLSEKMPDATHLKLCLINKGGKISRGTMLTTLEFLGESGKIRRNGKVINSKIGEFTIDFEKEGFSFRGISIPWGDVYSSYHSTGIENAEVYLAVSGFVMMFKSVILFLLKLLKFKFIKNIVAEYIKKNMTGPTKAERDSAETFIWGRVEYAEGDMIEEIYQVKEGYTLTAEGAAICAMRILNNEIKPGTYTPSLAFGSEFLDLFTIRKVL